MPDGPVETFCKLPHWLLARSDIGSSAKLIWAYLSDRQGNNGHSWPGQRRIAMDLGIDRKVVIRGVAEVEAAGLLTVERDISGKRNRYRIGTGTESPPVPKEDRHRSLKGTASGTESPPKPDSITRPIEPDPIKKARPVKKKIDPSPEAIAIYAEYPKKVARGPALTAIARALDRLASIPPDGCNGEFDPLPWLLGKVKEYAKARAGQETRFTPHPATWFNGERYLDDPSAWRSDGYGKRNDDPTAIRAPEGKYAKFNKPGGVAGVG